MTPTPLYRKRAHPKRSAGFGLIEVMVALVIGMFGVVVMMQVLSLSEEQKRTTTGAGDAMNEGVLALYALQSDIRMAGYGVSDLKLMGCGLTLRTGVALTSVAPVVINSASITGQDANTDTLIVFYGNSNGSPQGDKVSGTGNAVQTPSTFAAGDWVIDALATRATPCNLTLDKVSGLTPAVSPTSLTLTSAAALPVGDTVFNLGQTYRAVGYAIRSGNLTMCDYTDATKNCTTAGAWASIANNIVSLRAQYGQDTAAGAMDGIVDVYNSTNATPTTACSWARISALRLVLVARSAQFEKTVVTTTAPTWEGSAADNPTGSTASPIDLSSTTGWQNYRYKVFQTVVPLRNISWMGVVSGC